MKINKQLFEDVLSGKLKGTFVLRSKQKISSDKLICNNSLYSQTHPYRLLNVTYTSNGLSSLYNSELPDDIIDFIVNTDMKQNELTIEIPEGKIVDWEESKKQNKIVLKDKQLTYRDVCIELFKCGHFYTDSNGIILESPHSIVGCGWSNNAPTRHQLECILAKNKLATVAKYLNNGWKPKPRDIVYGLMLEGQQNILFSQYTWNTDTYYLPQFTFKSQKLAQQAIEILGEETVKLALEPLGI